MSEEKSANDPDQGLEFGRFKVDETVGKGGMGVVYRAHDPVIGRTVAIKALRTDLGMGGRNHDELTSRFEQEFRSAGTLSHPNIVTIYDVGHEHDTAYIAMEFVEGESLDTFLKAGKVMTFAQLSDLAHGLCAGLDFAHKSDIVHRDVKPANIMLTTDGVVKIADFGVAKVRSADLTQTGTVIGTPSYMAPEQIRGQEVSGATDQFAAAVIVFQMLTGQLPFAADEPTTTLYKIVHEEPEPPSALNPELPKALDGVLLKALAKDAGSRFESCSDFAQALREALGQPSKASPSLAPHTVTLSHGPTLRSSETYAAAGSWWQRRSGGSRAVVAILGALLFGTGGWFGVTWWLDQQSSQTDPAVETADEGDTAADVPEESSSTEESSSAAAGDLTPQPDEPPPTRVYAIETEPQGATVTLNGEPVEGLTPLVLELELGSSNQLAFALDGYHDSTQELASNPDNEAKLRVTLDKVIPPGRITVAADYETRASVRGGGSVRSLAPGRYTVDVTAPSVFHSSQHTVEVRSGEATQITLPSTVDIRVIAIPPQASVTVDGQGDIEPPQNVTFVEGDRHTIRYVWQDGSTREVELVMTSSMSQIIGSPDEIKTR